MTDNNNSYKKNLKNIQQKKQIIKSEKLKPSSELF